MVELIDTIFTYISIGYILSVNLGAYFLITCFDIIKKSKSSVLIKRILTIIAGISIWYLYHRFNLITITVAIPSFFLAVIAYDYLIKTILRKIGVLAPPRTKKQSN